MRARRRFRKNLYRFGNQNKTVRGSGRVISILSLRCGNIHKGRLLPHPKFKMSLYKTADKKIQAQVQKIDHYLN
jgi:hypothetical protein